MSEVGRVLLAENQELMQKLIETTSKNIQLFENENEEWKNTNDFP